MNAPCVDVNCDLGEVADSEGRRLDEQLLRFVSSANIACGVHAGDKDTMRSTIISARELGVAIGAHPGFADREGMGRRSVSRLPEQIYDLVRRQIETLGEIAQSEGSKLAHVKPHGALYHQATESREIADAICRGIVAVDRSLRIFTPFGGQLWCVGEAMALKLVSEVFADRNYLSNGRLVPRDAPNALVVDSEVAAGRVLKMILEREVEAIDGTRVPVHAQTISIHSDHPHSLSFANTLHTRLRESGIRIVPP